MLQRCYGIFLPSAHWAIHWSVCVSPKAELGALENWNWYIGHFYSFHLRQWIVEAHDESAIIPHDKTYMNPSDFDLTIITTSLSTYALRGRAQLESYMGEQLRKQSAYIPTYAHARTSADSTRPLDAGYSAHSKNDWEPASVYSFTVCFNQKYSESRKYLALFLFRMNQIIRFIYLPANTLGAGYWSLSGVLCTLLMCVEIQYTDDDETIATL